MTCQWQNRWLGIDFSGDHLKWGMACRNSNVWIAEVEQTTGLVLADLNTVQKLPGEGAPFHRLKFILAGRQFNSAGIDAPFSVPSDYVPLGKHEELLKVVSAIVRNGRCFPTATDLVARIIAGHPLRVKKPLRETEKHWRAQGVNVRSTLWAGPRGGAAMTAACLTLLHESGCPIWPWKLEGPGLLVEAFPAAQLRYWKLPHQKYNGEGREMRANRGRIIGFLCQHIEIDASKRQSMENSADALDAVICAFAAIAVTSGEAYQPSPVPPLAEGRIAVHRTLACRSKSKRTQPKHSSKI